MTTSVRTSNLFLLCFVSGILSASVTQAQSAPVPEGATVLYEHFYDDSQLGLDFESATANCEMQKNQYRSDYAIVACSKLEKQIPAGSSRGWHHHRQINYRTVYGLRVYGYSDVSKDLSTSREVLSSLKLIGGPALFADQDEAMDACSLVLASACANDASLSVARCTVQPAPAPSAKKFSYSIRSPF